MRGADVVIQLRKALPKLTDLFTTNVSVTSLTKSGNTVTAVTAVNHPFKTGDIINISGALTPFNVSSLTSDGLGTASVTTAQDHDFTQGYPSVSQMLGADQAEYNGNIISNQRDDYKTPLARNRADDRELLSVPNRRELTYAITGTPATPATGSNIRVIQNFAFGYNGLHQITKLTDTSFTYQVTKALGTPAEGTITASGKHRIATVANFKRLIEGYTKRQPNIAWAFVVLGDGRGSRDIYVNSDFQIENLNAFDYRQSVEQAFSVFVSLPTKTEIGGGDFADFFSHQMNKYIINSLVGVQFNSLFTNPSQYRCSYVGAVPFLYTAAYYIHEYQFIQSYYLTEEDSFVNDTSVAFRDLELKFENDAGEIMDAKINLDDKPLP